MPCVCVCVCVGVWVWVWMWVWVWVWVCVWMWVWVSTVNDKLIDVCLVHPVGGRTVVLIGHEL